MKHVPIDLGECRIIDCENAPTWLCDWNQTGMNIPDSDLLTITYCNKHRTTMIREEILSNWRPVKSHEEAIKEFWGEFFAK